MANAGFDIGPPTAAHPSAREPSSDEQAKQFADMTRFFDHEMRDTIAYVPDIAALKPRARVVVGIGADSASC